MHEWKITLLLLYIKTDILQQNRLTIVINKKDCAIERANDENTKSYTSEEVIDEVRKFLCNDVFKCSQEDLPQDSVILVSGSWALFARQHKSSSTLTKKEKSKVMKNLKDLTGTTLFDSDSEDTEIEEEKIPHWLEMLESYSGIIDLEFR